MEKDTNMADVSGVKITDLTACGASDDGEHIWITHRLGDGTEYPLIYPFEAIGYLITVLADAARSAQRRRVARNPRDHRPGRHLANRSAARGAGTPRVRQCLTANRLVGNVPR